MSSPSTLSSLELAMSEWYEDFTRVDAMIRVCRGVSPMDRFTERLVVHAPVEKT